MSILKKKKFLIPAGVLLVLAGVAVAVFWPYWSARQSMESSHKAMAKAMEQAESEFPEIVDYDNFWKAREPKDNGWSFINKAYKRLKKAESKSYTESQSDKVDWFGDATEYIRHQQGEPDIPSMKLYLTETEPILDLFNRALEYGVISPPASGAEGELNIVFLLEIMKFPAFRAEMLALCGRQEQAEIEYFKMLELYSKFKCDSSLMGLMIHTAVKSFLYTTVIEKSTKPKLLLGKAIEYSSKNHAYPYAALYGELAFMHMNMKVYMEVVDSVEWDEVLQIWDDEDGFDWGEKWKGLAAQTLLTRSCYQTTFDAVVSLRIKKIDYLDLAAIASFTASVDQQDENLEGFRTSDLLVYKALKAPLGLKINELNLKLLLLEVQSGSLLANKPAVEALVKKLLPQFHVVWDDDNADDTNSCWMEEAIFKISARPEYLELFGDYDLPELEYEPLKKLVSLPE